MDAQIDVIKNLTFVGTLMFHEFPSTCVFQDETGNPWIQEWIDVTDEGDDLFILFRTSTMTLNEFIKGNLSHLDFITKHFCFSFEGAINNMHNFKVVAQFPFESLPQQNTFFDIENGVDIDKITEVFSLKDYSINETIKRLEHYGKEKNCDLINIHLNSGDKVKYGSVETQYFTNIISQADALRREIALDSYFGKHRGGKHKLNRELTIKTGTELVILKAASFSAYLRPISSCSVFPGEISAETAINQKFISMLDISNEKEVLKDIVSDNSSYVTAAYINFLETVHKEDARFEVGFYNSSQNKGIIKNIFPKQARLTLDTIKELFITNEDTFSVQGKFTSLNCENGSFKFKDNNKSTYSGKFETNLISQIDTLIFTQEYKITIHRKKTKKPNSTTETVEDKIITFPE